jgi:hypothetical protein
MTGEVLVNASDCLAIFLLAMLMMTRGTNAPDSFRFTSMVAGAEDRKPDIRV